MRIPGVAVLCALAACGGVDSSARVGAAGAGAREPAWPVYYLPGEHMEWEVRWAGVLFGRVQLAAGAEGQMEGTRALVVRSVASSDGALAMFKRGSMALTTWIDLDRARPLAQEGSFDEIYTGEFLGGKVGAADWPRTPWQPDLGQGQVAQSSHTMLGLLRAWRPRKAGERAVLYVRLRQRVLRLDAVAVGRERVASALGRRDAQRIDALATPVDGGLAPEAGQRSYPVVVWIDEATERVPVKVQIESGFGGVVELSLVTYDPPGTLAVE